MPVRGDVGRSGPCTACSSASSAGLLGLGIGIPAGLSFTQIDGLPGVMVPWAPVAVTLLVVPLLAAVAGWLVTPTWLALVRRAS